jgi:hypothetical protein
MRYLKMAIILGVLGFAGCGMGRDDTPPPEVNLDVSEIEIEIGEPYIPDAVTGDMILEMGE